MFNKIDNLNNVLNNFKINKLNHKYIKQKKLFITFCIIRIIINVIINCFYNFFNNNIQHIQSTKNKRIINNNVIDCVKTKNKIVFIFFEKKKLRRFQCLILLKFVFTLNLLNNCLIFFNKKSNSFLLKNK